MQKNQGLTVTEVIVSIAVISLLLAILILQMSKFRCVARRVICGTNLETLGVAMVVYGNDYDDEFPRLGKGPWAKELGYSYEDNAFAAYKYEGASTISSSLYLLVREADVSPKTFICPFSDQTEFDGNNSKNLDIVELWDFGANPYPHVSYAYHNPYGKFPPDYLRMATFAIAADMSPWISNGDFVTPGINDQPPQIIDVSDPKTWIRGNSSTNHIDKKSNKVEGQNILFGDGHTSFEKTPNTGVKNDNIYTYWSTDQNPSDQDKQGGTAPTSRNPENDAKDKNDSFLVL